MQSQECSRSAIAERDREDTWLHCLLEKVLGVNPSQSDLIRPLRFLFFWERNFNHGFTQIEHGWGKFETAARLIGGMRQVGQMGRMAGRRLVGSGCIGHAKKRRPPSLRSFGEPGGARGLQDASARHCASGAVFRFGWMPLPVWPKNGSVKPGRVPGN
jgi:hypothetical protein